MKKILLFSLFTQLVLAQNAVEITNRNIKVLNSSTSIGVQSTNTGFFGNAGLFENTAEGSTSSTLIATQAGFGAAIYSTNNGIGSSGIFQISNAASIATSLVARTNGLGSSGLFETTLNTNTSPTLSSLSNSNNYTFQAINSGSGTAGYFENSSSSNFIPVLIVKNNGGYNAASFSIDNINNSNDVIVATTTGTGSAAKLRSNGSYPTLSILQLGVGRGINSYSAGIAGYFNSSSSYSVITGTGNVGIGTATPDKAGLVVNTVVGSTPAIFGENTSGVGLDVAWPGIAFNGYYNAGRKPLVDGFVGGINMDPSNGLIKIYNSAASGTANTNISQFDRVYINNQGKVGIGVSSPDQLLDVNGRARIRHNTFTAGIWMSNSLNSTNGADGAFYGMKTDTEAGIYIGNAWRFWVNNTGNVTVGGTVTASCGVLVCSDLRYKKNITSLNNSLENILQINGVRYDFKKEDFPERNFSDKNQIGFIAQQLEKIYPEMVFTDEKGYKSVDYARLTPVLVEALKEQQQMIDQLKSDNHILNSKNEKLESRLDKIEAILSK